MSDSHHCAECGADLPAYWPKGFCAQCALDGALEMPPEENPVVARSGPVILPGLNPPVLSQPVASQLEAPDLEGAGGSLRNTPIAPTAWATEKVGDNIGHYKLLQKLGQGGCGVVYLAEQVDPVRRRVALKVIKLGMDTKAVVARFEAERQALALMDHPNIAKVLEAGATASGRPFFVMELVRGVKITDYCNRWRLRIDQRLRLFIQVCQAVQHAHQKGIIHRDLKPSNVLVMSHDGVPVPKVIDFGIAKATTDQRLTDKTLLTAFDQFIGTPAYMSPEQVEWEALDIDTRSDIYSLGVLLYELLTGSTPFDAKELMASGLEGMRKTIREKEPQRPSTKLRATLAASRAAGPSQPTSRRPHSTLASDLDWIVLKCLEKDRTRRYETANSLAMDIQRHLQNEPVAARPPSAAYRFKKMVRRNRLAFAAGLAVLLALLLGVVGSSWQAFRATRAEHAATREQNRTQEALNEEKLAKAELKETLERERLDAYFHHITLAHRDLSADNLAGALNYLAECPEDLRGWEWRYLVRLGRIEPAVLREPGEIHSVSLHPDGTRVAAGCSDATVKIFDAGSGAVIQTLPGHGSYVYSLAFRPPDGRHLASAGADRIIRVWDLSSGEEEFQLPGHVGEYHGMANSVTFSPDGRLLLGSSEDGFSTLRNASNGQEVLRLPEQHENTATCAAFNSDGTVLATGDWGGVLRIWDVGTGRLRRRIPAHQRRIAAIAFSPDDQRIASASFDRTVAIWNPGTGERAQILEGHVGLVTGLAWSRHGRRLFSCGGEDKTVRIWDPVTGREILSLRGHTSGCHSLVSSPDGNRLYSSGGDGTIRVWDAMPLQGDEGPSFRNHEHESEVWSVEFSPDNQRIASCAWAGTVSLWDARTGDLRHALAFAPDVRSAFRVAFDPEGKRLAAAGSTSRGFTTASVWETATGGRIGEEIRAGNIGFCVAFDPSGRHLVREGPGHAVQVLDAGNGSVIGIVGRHDRQIWCMTFSSDGQKLATSSNDGTIRVWDWIPAELSTPQEPQLTLPVPVGGYGHRVAFSPDGLRLASRGEGHTARIWDAVTGAEVHTLRDHTGDVLAVAFSPDGRWLATAGEDTTVRIWDTKSWVMRHKLRGHIGWVGALAFSPDSRHLASGSRDHTMKIWDATQWEEPPGRQALPPAQSKRP